MRRLTEREGAGRRRTARLDNVEGKRAAGLDDVEGKRAAGLDNVEGKRAAGLDDVDGKRAARLDDVEGKRTAEADGAGMNVMKGAGAGGQASQAVTGPQGGWNQRKTMLLLMAFSVVLLAAVTVAGQALEQQALVTDFSRKNLPPSLAYPFGTDFMGRDMFVRTVTGLSMSIRIGLLTAAVSAAIACVMGLLAATMGRFVDGLIIGLIDLVLGIPHILLLVLISFAMGKGFWGVVVGISLTHWTSLARLIRAEVLQLKASQYIRIAEKLGEGRLRIALRHMVPHLLPQLFVGLVLMFPHAILHEASITFLGFGLSPEQPAIGVILSESMKYLAMGRWWLALFPGLFLVFVVVLFHYTGDTLGRLLDPGHAHQ